MNGVIYGKNYNASALPTTVNRTAHVCQPSGPRMWDEENF